MGRCTSPLYRISVGSRNFPLLTPRDQERLKNHGVFLPYDAIQAYSLKPGWSSDDVQIIRCGVCQDCRLAYARDWAIRCSLEASRHEHNYFVTLTYDDNFLPTSLDGYFDLDGEIYESTLVRRDIQLFIKSLREWERLHGNDHIKVFYCGEYGGRTGRPHFHLIVFGASEIPDLTFSFKRGDYSYYKSVTYERFWSYKGFLRGFVDITEASFDTIAYTARYCMKKIGGKIKKEFMEWYEELDPGLRPQLRTQPFIGMSLKPGIAAEYFAEHHDQILKEDVVKYTKQYQLFNSKPPRYFDKLFEREDPGAFALVKAKRKQLGIAAAANAAKLTDEDYLDRLKRQADMTRERQKKYVRDL